MTEKWNLSFEEKRIWISLGGSILFSFLLAVLVILLDTRIIAAVDYVPNWALTSVDLARAILSLLAGSLLTVATFTFSTMLTIITLYTSNFSPRATENFLLNRTSMQTLGIFLGGFIYSLASLFFMRSSEDEFLVVSATVALVYAFGAVISFTRFIYTSSEYVQLEKLIHRLYKEASDVFDNYIQRFKDYPTLKHLPDMSFMYTYEVQATKSAYIEHISFDTLKAIADETESNVIVSIRVGHFVTKGQPVMELKTNQKLEEDMDAITKRVNDSFSYESEKSSMYDPDFARTKLTEVALRAVSPGINDPNTAIHILKYKSLLEKRLAGLPGKYVIFHNDEEEGENEVRLEEIEEEKYTPANKEKSENEYTNSVFYRYNDFAEDLHTGYWQLVFYMQQDISGVNALFEAIETIAYSTHEDNLGFVKEYNDYLYNMTSSNFEQPFDQNIIENNYERIKTILKKKESEFEEKKEEAEDDKPEEITEEQIENEDKD
ncbi:DUF2254 domain-containing protein [Alkalibacterium putridalgicola]|uniref:DUF2254 domain-containing protein n=1 Tax=Alkalibacterium putridalgicola TaxID=426703 RepID=UPI0034CE0363